MRRPIQLCNINETKDVKGTLIEQVELLNRSKTCLTTEPPWQKKVTNMTKN